jgi:hypothetical protein
MVSLTPSPSDISGVLILVFLQIIDANVKAIDAKTFLSIHG